MAKKLEKQQQAQSPYSLFTQWLFNPNFEDVLPEWVIRALNPCSILHMFADAGSITIFLNDTFNNYSIYQIDRVRFYNYLKELVHKKRIQRSQLCYFKYHKEDKDISLIHAQLPQLKRREVSQFLDLVKDEDFYDDLMATFGLKEEKKTKLTAADKKRIEQNQKTNPTPVVVKETTAVGMKDWQDAFGGD